MRKIIFFITSLVIFSQSNVIAQCRINNIISEDTICASTAFEYSQSLSSPLWDFCAGDSKSTPSVSEVGTMAGASGAYPLNLQTVYDGSNFWGITAGVLSNTLYRINYGSSLSSGIQSSEGVLSLAGTVALPIAVKVAQENADWVVLITGQASNSIGRVVFTGGLNSSSPIASTLVLPEGVSAPYAIDVAKQGSNMFAAVTEESTGILAVLSFGNSLKNNVSGINKISIPGASKLRSVKFFNSCGVWYAFLVDNITNKLYKVKFGSSLSNPTPIVSAIASIPDAFAIDIINADGKTIGFASSVNTGKVYKIIFDDNIDAEPMVTNIGTFSSLIGALGLQMLSTTNAGLKGLAIEQNSNKIFSLDFAQPSNCASVSIAASDQSTVSVTYAQAGKYYTSLRANDANGNQVIALDSVFVVNAQAKFTNSYNCNTKQFSFDGTGSCAAGNIVSYTWDFGDNTPVESGTQITHSYTTDGTYTVKLTITDALGNTAYKTQNVKFQNSLPVPDFSHSSLLCSGTQLQFNDQSASPVDNIIEWKWIFGNDSTSNLKNPTVIYREPGQYSVKLTIKTANGCEASVEKMLNVAVGPAVKFGAENLCIGSSALFIDSTEFPSGTQYLAGSRLWSFGDNTPSDTTQNPTHAYAAAGTYQVNLTVSNTTGCISSLTKTIRIYPLPIPKFSFPALIFPDNVVAFKDSSTSAFQNIVSWSWSFGDPGSGLNNTSTLQNPTHTYSSPGFYTVQLNVTTNEGCVAQISNTIQVLRDCPSANFVNTATNPIVNETLVLTNTTLGANKYAWDFCAGDLRKTPLLEIQGAALTDSYNLSPVVDGDSCYIFSSSVNDGSFANPWQRIRYGNSFSNAPFIGIPLGNPPAGSTPNALNKPICVRVFKKDTAFYGIAINSTNNTLVRLFFDSLTGNVSAQPLTVSPAPIRPENIEVVQDGDSLYAFITSNTLNTATPSTANLLMRLSFGKSFANTPVVTVLNHPNLQQNNGGALLGMSFIKDCNTWYMTVVSNQGKIIRLNFGLSLNRTPTYFNATNEWLATLSEINNNQNNLVVKASMHRDMGKIYVFATTSAGVMARLSFDQLFLPPSSRRMIQNNSLGVYIRDIQFVKHKSEWHAFALNIYNSGIFKWSFPNECATENPIRTNETPLNVKYTNGGSYYITLEASDDRGWINSKLDSVVISSPEIQPIPVVCPSIQITAPTVACANQSITVSATTANAASLVTWDMCAGDIDNNSLTFNASSNLSNIYDCRGVDIVKSGNSYFCLVANNLERPTILSFGNSLDNSFSAAPIPLSGIAAPFYGASDIKAVQENGNWLVFLPFNSTPQTPNTPRQIVRMNYGASLTNTSPVFSSLSGGGLLSSPEGIALVEDNGQKYMFVVNSQGSRTVAVYQFGNSYFNTPKLSSFEVDSALSMKKIDFIKQCNRWYALITDTDGNSVIRLDFHKGISQKPLFRRFFLGQDVRPWGIKLATENGLFYALLTSSNDGQNKIRLIKFGNTMAANNITDAPSFEGLGVQVQSMLGFDIIKTPDSRIRMFGLAQYSPIFYKFSFAQNCSVNTPSATGANPADIVYSQNGNYSITATVDSAGITYTVPKPIELRSPVRPNFDSSGIFCAGEPVIFTNTSSLDPGVPVTSVSYQWSFGDNNTASTSNATHTYTSSGLYEVILKSIAPGGCENIKKKTIRIYGKPTPAFNFPAPSIGLCANDSIPFSDASTPAAFDQIVSRYWEVTDAQGTLLLVSQKVSPKFLFSQVGLYNVKLTVKGMGGCEVSLTKPVNITNLGAAVTISYSNNFCLGEAVQFTANVVNPVGTYTLEWNFGNNTSSDVLNPSVTYDLPGTYHVTLRVTNQAGCVSNVSQDITIFNKPTAAISNGATCVNAPITFDASGSSAEGSITEYSWDFGDGSPLLVGSEYVQAVHTYNTIGNYAVTLIIKTATGCTDTTEGFGASVAPSPTANFTVADVCVGNPLNLVNQSSANGIAGGLQYKWQFRNAANTADADVSTLANPTFTYTTAGTYTIILTTTANNGCPSILAKQVTIAATPQAKIAIDEGCVNAPFGFRDVSVLPTPSDEVISRLWTISRNGQVITTRTDANPQLLFSAVGSYTVKLEIKTKNGCSATSATSTFAVGQLPEANFNVATTAITTIPATIQFANVSSNAVRYLWDFGDGTTSIEPNPIHEFAEEKIYRVRLTAYRNDICFDTVSKLVSVFVQINRGVQLTNIAAVRSATNNISISLQVKNEGNIELTSLDLVAQLGDGLKVRERWTGSLPANATMEYPFKALFITRNQDVVPFVCAEALLVNPTQEITPDNNKLCKTLSNSFSLIAVRPNPADNILNVSYLVTETADVSLEIIDILGKRVIVREMGSQTASIYDLSINTDELPEGMYYVRLNVGKDRIAQKLLISHP